MKVFLAVVVSLVAAPALAHTGAGHVDSFAAGFTHPLYGLDHLLAMVLVGLWAGLIGGARAWAWPVSFVGAMLVGGMLGLSGFALPAAETLIAGSVMVLGLVVAFHVSAPVAFGAAGIAVFGLTHGYAHGAEAAGASFATYAAGFVLATALLHAVGYFGVRFAGATAARVTGAIGALAGLFFVFA